MIKEDKKEEFGERKQRQWVAKQAERNERWKRHSTGRKAQKKKEC